MKDIILDSIDTLYETNDELARLDFEIENYLKILEKKILELQPKFEFTINIKNVPNKVEDAIGNFTWDESKYPKRQKVINDIIKKIVEKYESSMTLIKNRSDEFQSEQEKLKLKMKSDMEAMQYMKTDYRDILKNTASHLITTTYLRPVLCFVQQ